MRSVVGTPITSNIDEARSEPDRGAVDGETIFLQGDRYFVRGWAFAREQADPIRSVEIIANGFRADLGYGAGRPDVAAAYATDARCGFSEFVALDTVRSRRATLHVNARLRSGAMRELASINLRLALRGDECAALPTTGSSFRSRIRFVRSTRRDSPPFGWSSRRNIVLGGTVEVRGWIVPVPGAPPAEIALVVEGEGRRRRYPASLICDGEATVLGRLRPEEPAGFSEVLALDNLEPGLYEVTAWARSDGGATFFPGATASFAIAPRMPEAAPRFLPVHIQTPEHCFTRFGPFQLVRGEPVVTTGWAIDPTTRRGGALYAQFDDQAVLPLPMTAGTGTEPYGAACFGGIVDTLDLQPGSHRLRILLLPSLARGWYVVADEHVDISEAPLPMSPTAVD